MVTAGTEESLRVWMTYAQAAEYTGLNRTTIWRAVEAGNLEAYGVGRAVRFQRVELDRWMRNDEK
ncbi:helix-turn-helix domain-containing protein [Rubrobacter indicoceani]|uniref:helix-turn-helix domain-containing protein n=1 Tax=Rubrobacter indicoceani TaxID=2051957 RepID=UPI000E5AD435